VPRATRPCYIKTLATSEKAGKRVLSRFYSIEKEVNKELGCLIKNHKLHQKGQEEHHILIFVSFPTIVELQVKNFRKVIFEALQNFHKYCDCKIGVMRVLK